MVVGTSECRRTRPAVNRHAPGTVSRFKDPRRPRFVQYGAPRRDSVAETGKAHAEWRMIHALRSRRPLSCLVAAVLATAGGAAVGGPLSAQIDTSALPTLELEVAWTLGGPNAPEHESFTGMPLVAVNRHGTLFAVDQALGVARRFDETGAYLGSVGRQGEGPGEFGYVLSVGFTGDSLWMRNASPPYVEFFDPGGEPLGRYTVENPVIARGGMPAGPAAMLQGGARYSVGVVPIQEAGVGRVEVPLVLTRSDGTMDTLAHVTDPAGFYIPGVGGIGNVVKDRPSPLHAPAVDGSRVWIASWSDERPGRVDLRKVDARGGPEVRFSVNLQPLPLSRAVTDSIVGAAADSVRSLARRVGSLEVPDDLRTAAAEVLGLGAYLPPIRRMVPGADGSLWLERATAPNRSEWMVLDGTGEPVGRVELPDVYRLVAASMESGWTTRRDEYDVAYVTRFGFAPRRGR